MAGEVGRVTEIITSPEESCEGAIKIGVERATKSSTN